MALYLVQHGKSLPKDIDPDQGLSEEGRKEVEKMAKFARDQGVRVSCIKHSGKKRARQTAEIFASLNPKEGIQETSGINPLDDVTAFAPTLNSQDDLMLVGHLPFMERLVAYHRRERRFFNAPCQVPMVFDSSVMTTPGINPVDKLRLGNDFFLLEIRGCYFGE